jgi:hypothetical protein
VPVQIVILLDVMFDYSAGGRHIRDPVYQNQRTQVFIAGKLVKNNSAAR